MRESYERLGISTAQSTPGKASDTIRAEGRVMACSEGTSMNQCVATAVAEKPAVLNTAADISTRKSRADLAEFKRLLKTNYDHSCPKQDRS